LGPSPSEGVTEGVQKGSQKGSVSYIDILGSYRLALTLPPTWPAGRISEALRIHTDHPHAPLLTCPITGTLQNGDTP